MKRVIKIEILLSPADDQPEPTENRPVLRSPRGHRLAVSTWTHRILSETKKAIADMATQNMIPEAVTIDQLDYYYTAEQDGEVDNPAMNTREGK